MSALLRLFFDITCLRTGPQDIPDSGLLLALALVADLILSALVGLTGGEVIDAFLQSLVATVLLLAFLAVVLFSTSHWQRFKRTVTAALGCDALMTLVALPVTLLGEMVPGTGLLVLVVVFWNLVVFAHILRHALGIGYALAGALAFIYMVASMDLMAQIFGV